MNSIASLVVQAVVYFLQIMEYVIIARILLSWLPLSQDNFIVKTVYLLTEPILGPIRNLFYKSPLGGPGMMLDFSPIVAILALRIVGTLLIRGFLV